MNCPNCGAETFDNAGQRACESCGWSGSMTARNHETENIRLRAQIERLRAAVEAARKKFHDRPYRTWSIYLRNLPEDVVAWIHEIEDWANELETILDGPDQGGMMEKNSPLDEREYDFTAIRRVMEEGNSCLPPQAQAYILELERERDELMESYKKLCRKRDWLKSEKAFLHQRRGDLVIERDEARAEIERLRAVVGWIRDIPKSDLRNDPQKALEFVIEHCINALDAGTETTIEQAEDDLYGPKIDYTKFNEQARRTPPSGEATDD